MFISVCLFVLFIFIYSCFVFFCSFRIRFYVLKELDVGLYVVLKQEQSKFMIAMKTLLSLQSLPFNLKQVKNTNTNINETRNKHE